ncbi:MAG: class I SAM-dependent methyltransferase [Anaerolineae bacterium]
MKEQIKNILGNILISLQPKKAAELSANGMTLIVNDKLTLQERLMRNAILKKTEENQDFDTLAEFHRNYWVNQGTEYFSLTDDNFETVFLPDCAFIFELLQDQLENGTQQPHTLIEIGTGNGDILNYLGEKLSQIDKLIGIDLSPDQTKINQNKFKDNSRLEFVASDGFEWVNKHGTANMIFVTSRGVLEYFTQERLLAFFNKLNSLENTIFVAIEPNGLEHDFSINPDSQPYGNERSFSHNYPKLFTKAGFKLWHQSRKAYPDNDHYLSFIGARN